MMGRGSLGSSRGFTLLEVMVAVAILGLGLTAILTAQFGALDGVSRARGMSGAVGYARCKMSEVEERLRRDGFPELAELGDGVCCGEESPGYWCEWRIERPVFPDGTSAELDLDTSNLGALGKMSAGPAAGAPGNLDPGAGISGITQALGPGAQELAAGGVSGIASTVMGMVYPSIKRLFEASSRRVTVVIHWNERGRDQSFDVVQWVTNPQRATGIAADASDAGGVPGTSSGAPNPAGMTGGAR